MLTNALSKVTVKYHNGLRSGLLFAAFFAFNIGLLSYGAFTEENETITKETGHLFWKKTTETTIHHNLSERIPHLIEAMF
jgi:hydrogenase-4 membrane subunit HyfE